MSHSSRPTSLEVHKASDGFSISGGQACCPTLSVLTRMYHELLTLPKHVAGVAYEAEHQSVLDFSLTILDSEQPVQEPCRSKSCSTSLHVGCNRQGKMGRLRRVSGELSEDFSSCHVKTASSDVGFLHDGVRQTCRIPTVNLTQSVVALRRGRD